MTDENNNLNSLKMNYINIYALITLILIVIFTILSHYFNYVKIFYPILILISIYSIRLIKINNECSNLENLPFTSLFNRALMLLCVFLYSEYTVKCIPILDIIFNKIFTFPVTGKLLKSFFSFLIMEFSDNIFNVLTIDNTKDFLLLDNICKINTIDNNIFNIFLVLMFILLNTYINELKSIIS